MKVKDVFHPHSGKDIVLLTYPDDDYFFLKLFDASRKGYVRNPVAERISQDL
ncbi:MAG: hypothetical protein AB7D92_11170 [Sphaerochaeta sp.]